MKVSEDISLTHKRNRGSKELIPNPEFLSPESFGRYLERIKPMLLQTDAVMPEFEYLNRDKMKGVVEFIEALDVFISNTPTDVPIAVETRNKNYLTKDYFQFLKERNIIHVFSEKLYLPHIYEVYEQFADYISGTTVIRLLGGDRGEIEKLSGNQWNKIVDGKPDNIERRRVEPFPTMASGFTIPVREIGIDMAMAAWYPHGFCRLTFGLQDKLQEEIDKANVGSIRAGWIEWGSLEWKALRERFAVSVIPERYLRFVPYRLLAPFFSMELRGKADAEKNNLIVDLASRHFATEKPLYCFTESGDAIIIHNDWLEYLDRNILILRGWVRFQLAEYLQRLNPSIPGIVEKLSPPLRKSPLTVQTRWWKAALHYMPAESCCIHSVARFDQKDIALDHFLPWSFVAHDRLWNLVPVSRRVNSLKLDRLPSMDYREQLSQIQHSALVATANAWEEKRWLKTVEPFMLDLKLGRDSLLRESELRNALYANMKPLFEIAKGQGFASDWVYVQE